MDHGVVVPEGSSLASAAVIMPLKPYQQVVDIPESIRKNRTKIRWLSIASLCLALFIGALTHNVGTFANAYIGVSAFLAGLPILLTLISSCIVLRNTSIWVERDVCCNVMRPHPACCTRCCNDYKCCCARVSYLLIAAATLTGLGLLGLGILSLANLVQISYDMENGNNFYHGGYSYGYDYQFYYNSGYGTDIGRDFQPEETHEHYETEDFDREEFDEDMRENGYDPDALGDGFDPAQPPPAIAEEDMVMNGPSENVYDTDFAEPHRTDQYYYGYYETHNTQAGGGIIAQQFFVGVSMIALVSTLSVSAFLLHSHETKRSLPALLPAGKMVVLVDGDDESRSVSFDEEVVKSECV